MSTSKGILLLLLSFALAAGIILRFSRFETVYYSEEKALVAFPLERQRSNQPDVSDVSKATVEDDTRNVIEENEAVTAPVYQPTVLKSGNVLVFYDVPFTPQAPLGDWSYPWQDACEEAVVLMARSYFLQQSISTTSAVADILKLVDYQNEVFGSYHDTDARDTAAIAESVYSIKAHIEENPEIEDITEALQKGFLVIMPMAGRLLGNRFFTPPGPAYHMLLAIGFDEERKELIVHDPGTKRGARFRYSYATIMSALHDWTGSDETIETGASRIIVIEGLLP
jgi:hypothetical protein